MLRKSTFMLLAVLMIAALPGSAVGSSGLGPINPEFLEYRSQGRFLQPSMAVRAGGDIPSPVDLSHIRGEDIRFPSSGSRSRTAILPAKYDLRDYGYVSSVKNQDPYGTCWAFAAMSSMESTFIKNTGEINDFSEAHLAYFAYVDYASDLPAFTTGNDPEFGMDPIFDQGGNIWKSTAILSRWTGAVDETDRPYQSAKPWPSSALPKTTDPVSKHLENVFFLGSDFDRDTMKGALMEYGAVAFRFLWGEGDDIFNASTDAYYNPDQIGGGHAVTLVGWDDGYSASNFAQNPGSNGAWLVKNSWGSEWGTSGGYFWISYNDPTIGYPGVFQGASSDKFSQIYQHDPLGFVNSYGWGETAWFANVFTSRGIVGGDEELKAVSFYNTSSSCAYSIEVWINGEVGNPRSGTLAVAAQTGELSVPGYHTVALDAPVILSPGTRFAVVVRMNTPGYGYPVAVEYPEAGYSDKATALADQSYIGTDGATWDDMTVKMDNANVCLKAFSSVQTRKSGSGGGCNVGVAPGLLLVLSPLLFLGRKTR